MGSVSRLSPSGAGRPAAARQPGKAIRPQPLRVTVLGIAALVCGATVGVKFDIVGELYLIELLITLLAMQCLLSRGVGKNFVAPIFFGFLVAGLITFFGYLISDLFAANEPWQYLKGWGRVALLILDCSALVVLVAHDRQILWWLALGMAVGGIAMLAVDAVPITTWKLGYGEYAALLVLTLAPLTPGLLGAGLVGAFGVACVMLDYRSLGAACVVVAAVVAYRKLAGGGDRGSLRKWIGFCLAAAATSTALTVIVVATEETYAERRELSNVGRYAGLVVAWRAVSESPLLGYGSWAAQERFARMLQSEVRGTEAKLDRKMDMGRSLLPHSQILQAWIEGGVLALAFFLFFAWHIASAFRWYVFASLADALLPLCLFTLVFGAWNLVASPFLGYTRVHIAMAVAASAIACAARRLAQPPRVPRPA